ISVVTQEFMDDFGLNSLEEISSYAANLGVDLLETRAEPNPGYLSGLETDTRLTVRGHTASRSMDFFEANIPIDSYNIGRFELSSGPNSILFGLGNPGGTANITTKIAGLDRNRTSVRMRFGDWNIQ